MSSRSTAVDLLNARGMRDSRRQHIQHQLDSLRFYDSVPLYDGLRRLTPAAAVSSSAATAAEQGPSRGDSPWPPAPPSKPRPAPRKRLRRVASEPTECARGRPKQSRGIWSLAGSGRPSAAPRWPTTTDTVGGLRPRHWPPVNDRGPYWIRLESALTMTKPEDEENAGVDDEGRTYEYRVDVPASEQRRSAVNDHHHHQHHHCKVSSKQQETCLGNGHQYPSPGQHYPGPDLLQSGNSHQCPNGGHQHPIDKPQSLGGGQQQQYPDTEQSHFNTGHRYPSTARQHPGTTQPGTAATEQLGNDGNVGYFNDDEGIVRTVCESEDRNAARQQSYGRRHHQRHRQNHHDASAADVTVTTAPTVDPPRYELFTHV